MKKKIVMADKSFEQRVKEELGSLKMRPDGEVWVKVEAALHKEKKRRWLVWLFLFAALSGASVWGYLKFEGKEQRTSIQEPSKQETKGQETKGQETKEQETKGQETKGQETKGQETKEQETKEQETGKLEEKKEGLIKQGTPKQENVREESNKTESTQNTIAKTYPEEQSVKTKSSKGKIEALQNKTAVVKNKRLETFTNVSPTVSLPMKKETESSINVVNNSAGKEKPPVDKNTDNVTGTAKKEIDQKGTVSNAVAATEKNEVKETKETAQEKSNSIAPPADTTVVAKIVAPKKETKKKWEYSIAIDAGISGIRNGLPFSGPGNFYNNPPNNSIPPTGSPITGTVIPEIKDAFGFSAHFKAASQLDKTFGIGFSAGYTLLQTATNVGRRVDSSALASQAAYAAGSARAYYVSADSLRYTNRYHYLGIGAELYTSFKLFKTVAAKWQFGGGLNFMIASNGLHYDASSGYLFQKNALFSYLQPYIITGVDFAIGKIPFMYIGPHFQYFPGHLTKKATSGEHLAFTSLQLSFILRGKKK
jgi:hypothetical protein